MHQICDETKYHRKHIVQKVYEWPDCYFAKIIFQSGDYFGKRTSWSLIYFLNYAYYYIQPSHKFDASPSRWFGLFLTAPPKQLLLSCSPHLMCDSSLYAPWREHRRLVLSKCIIWSGPLFATSGHSFFGSLIPLQLSFAWIAMIYGAFFCWNPELLRLSRQTGKMNSGAFGVF